MPRLCRAAALAALFVLHSPLHAAELEQAIVPADEVVDGLSQGEWSRVWWQWASSFARSDSPVSDQTGEKCHLKQGGPVWFLAGTYGTRRTIRSCNVPSNKYLYFPLINYVAYPRDPQQPPTCDEVTADAKAWTDDVSSLVLDLNGVRARQLEKHRQATTQCFDLRPGVRRKLFPTAANGYFVMLKPLAPGSYELNFGGALPGSIQAVTYHLVVE